MTIPGREIEPPGCICELVCGDGLCQLGGEAAADGGGVGVCGAGWVGGQKYPWWGDVIDSGRANYNRIMLVIRHPCVGIRPTITVCTTWRAMCGSGAWMSMIRISTSVLLVRIRYPVRLTLDWVIINFTGVKTSRVLRGGSWTYDPELLRVANRSRSSPTVTRNLLGFRCARSQ